MRARKIANSSYLKFLIDFTCSHRNQNGLIGLLSSLKLFFVVQLVNWNLDFNGKTVRLFILWKKIPSYIFHTFYSVDTIIPSNTYFFQEMFINFKIHRQNVFASSMMWIECVCLHPTNSLAITFFVRKIELIVMRTVLYRFVATFVHAIIMPECVNSSVGQHAVRLNTRKNVFTFNDTFANIMFSLSFFLSLLC